MVAPITSIERYRRTLLFERLGFSSSQIAALGGGATQFSIVGGDPSLTASQVDIGAFLGDDWKLSRSFTLSLGLRYEKQTNIHDPHDFAPRVGLAWAPRAKMVVRAGFGIFYDRFGLANTMTALRRNGVRQQQSPRLAHAALAEQSMRHYREPTIRPFLAAVCILLGRSAPCFWFPTMVIHRRSSPSSQLPMVPCWATTFIRWNRMVWNNRCGFA